jgi:hypothetical protein
MSNKQKAMAGNKLKNEQRNEQTKEKGNKSLIEAMNIWLTSRRLWR